MSLTGDIMNATPTDRECIDGSCFDSVGLVYSVLVACSGLVFLIL